MRSFDLSLPDRIAAAWAPPADPAATDVTVEGGSPAARSSTAQATVSRLLRLTAPEHLYIPRVLERDGLAAYEPETVAAFLALAERYGGPVLDVGANVGVFSFLAAALTHVEVVAFEPTPELAETARGIATANGVPFQVEELALAAERGTATFYLSTFTDSSNSLLEGFRPSEQSITVTVDTLDSYCRRTGHAPTVLKVDTEATEPDVLRGGLETIRAVRPWIVCEVLARRTEAALEELLAPLDYTWYQITSELPLAPRREIFGDRSYAYKNWLFAPSVPDEDLWEAMRVWQTGLAACVPLPPPVEKPRAAPVPPPPRAGNDASPEHGTDTDVAEAVDDVPEPPPASREADEEAKPKPAKPKPAKRKGVYGRKKMLAGFLIGVCCGAATTALRRRS